MEWNVQSDRRDFKHALWKLITAHLFQIFPLTINMLLYLIQHSFIFRLEQMLKPSLGFEPLSNRQLPLPRIDHPNTFLTGLDRPSQRWGNGQGADDTVTRDTRNSIFEEVFDRLGKEKAFPKGALQRLRKLQQSNGLASKDAILKALGAGGAKSEDKAD